jgi:hypothetical protein
MMGRVGHWHGWAWLGMAGYGWTAGHWLLGDEPQGVPMRKVETHDIAQAVTKLLLGFKGFIGGKWRQNQPGQLNAAWDCPKLGITTPNLS